MRSMEGSMSRSPRAEGKIRNRDPGACMWRLRCQMLASAEFEVQLLRFQQRGASFDCLVFTDLAEGSTNRVIGLFVIRCLSTLHSFLPFRARPGPETF